MGSSQRASAILVPLVLASLLAGCGRAATTTGAGGESCGSKGQADVVVELANRHVLDRCVNLGAKQTTALTLMHRSGLEYSVQHFSFGDAVCQIDNQPAAYSNCLASGQPYWALYTWAGKGPWKLAQTGVSDIRVRAGGALGWHFGNGSPPPPPRPPLAG